MKPGRQKRMQARMNQDVQSGRLSIRRAGAGVAVRQMVCAECGDFIEPGEEKVLNKHATCIPFADRKIKTARHTGGFCPQCGDPLVKGERIVKLESRWAHAECEEG